MRQAALTKQAVKGVQNALFAGCLEGFADKKEARGLVGDRQGVTVPAVAQLELALEVGAPEVIGIQGLAEGCAFSPVALPLAGMGYEAVPVENGMARAFGRHPHIAGELLD